jgi:hypothetical protein
VDSLLKGLGQAKLFQLAAGHIDQFFAHILQRLTVSLKLRLAGPVILLML